jgi:hypothetical protein
MNHFNRGTVLVGIALALSLGLSGCDIIAEAVPQLGMEGPSKRYEKQMAEAKAIGSACRHAGRAIEDCYTINPTALRAGIFAGWKDMDTYMKDNHIEAQKPLVAPEKAPEPPKPPEKKKKKKTPVDSDANTETAPNIVPDLKSEMKAEKTGKEGGKGH